MGSTDQDKYCKYGDPHCPCQEGLQCAYEGLDPLPTPAEKLQGAFPTGELNNLARLVLTLQRRVNELEQLISVPPVVYMGADKDQFDELFGRARCTCGTSAVCPIHPGKVSDTAAKE